MLIPIIKQSPISSLKDPTYDDVSLYHSLMEISPPYSLCLSSPTEFEIISLWEEQWLRRRRQLISSSLSSLLSLMVSLLNSMCISLSPSLYIYIYMSRLSVCVCVCELKCITLEFDELSKSYSESHESLSSCKFYFHLNYTIKWRGLQNSSSIVFKFSGNVAQRGGSRQNNNVVWLNRKSPNRSLRVNGLFGGGKKDNNDEGQSKVYQFICSVYNYQIHSELLFLILFGWVGRDTW